MSAEWALCDGCGLHKKLRKDGLTPKHQRRVYQYGHHFEWVTCPGSLQPPRQDDRRQEKP